MIIQKLIDNYAIEKNEKESLELQLMHKEREFQEIKNRLVFHHYLYQMKF